jgi:predicted dehydrogenase
MKVAFTGCGYVFDIYMRTKWAHPEIEVCGVYDIDTMRSATVSQHYGYRVYPSYEALLGDPEIQTVINLTSIRSHYEVVKRALQAGKHVYSEKPLTKDSDQTRELFALAAERALVLTGAPDNLFCDAIGTVWKAVRDGIIGQPALVYAELDDNPAHLMRLDTVESPTGQPFPFIEELQAGCTLEHVTYHLVWICALFGPALSVTAFSKHLVPNKTVKPLSPPDAPDFSVACLEFAGDVAARITCSWVAPRDHRFRIIGEKGEISVDNIFHDQSPVRFERFSRVSLAARKAYTVRNQPLIGRCFGVGGRRLELVRRWKSHAVEAERGVGTSLKHRFVAWLRRKEIYAQDKLLGIAEMARAMREGRPQPMPPDFLMHINEITLLIHGAGPQGATIRPTTTFQPLHPPDIVAARDYRLGYRPPLVEAFAAGLIERLHRA